MIFIPNALETTRYNQARFVFIKPDSVNSHPKLAMKISFRIPSSLSLASLILASLTLVLAQGSSIAQTAAAPAAAEPITVATAPAKITDLIKIDTVIGTGTEATPGSYLDVNYTGWIYNPNAADRHGTMFDSSSNSGRPLTFQLDARSVIRGWDLGIRGMKVGGKRTLIIPGYLAYGPKGSTSIPPNATLIFDVEVVSAR